MDMKAFRTDLDKEKDGVWVDLGMGSAIKVARFNNPEFIARFRDMPKHQSAALRRGTIDDDELEVLFIEAIADTVLLDWRGFVEHSKPMEYSRETAIRVLSDPNYGLFKDTVIEEARNIENFREEELEDIAKNSHSISDGS